MENTQVPLFVEDLNEAIRATIDWYRTHENWWRSIKSGEYLKYYEQQYVTR